MSHETSCASERIRARSFGEPGSSGGSGWTSSRYSMIAIDWPSRWPSSTRVGTSACGLIVRYDSPACSPVGSQITSGSQARFLQFRAILTRNAAELRK
jgi:hypothetical protein